MFEATTGVVAIQKLHQKFDNIDPTLLFKLFDRMVLPILMYGAVIYGTNYNKQR